MSEFQFWVYFAVQCCIQGSVNVCVEGVYYFLFFLLSHILIWLIMVCVFNSRVCGFNIFAVITPTFISSA